MKLKSVLLFLVVIGLQPLFAQEKASAILEKAYDQAKLDNKNVIVMFHASWCGWCKRMDKNMNDDACKDLFNNNYVTTHLVVKEAKDKRHLENPGAQEFLEKYNGDKSGIPFWLVLNHKGELLTDSFNSEGSNLGCPTSEEEVAEFIKILQDTSDLTDEECKIIAKVFIIKKF